MYMSQSKKLVFHLANYIRNGMAVAVRGDFDNRGKVVWYPVWSARRYGRALKSPPAVPSPKKNGYFGIFKVQHASQTAWSAISL